MDTLSAGIARAYDEVPYTSRPFPQSQPQRIAALGKLFGLSPQNVATARVLELGCASGGNLIPLASQFPDASFIGIDLSPVQISEGQARIASMGIKNIRLINMSIADVTAGLGRFDYILCHGVYSWVPAAVRDAILRVCHDNLAEHGMAYVSYNVYPGWRLRAVLRDAMMFHASTAENPSKRIALGRDFLNQLGAVTNAGTAYGQMLRHEATSMAQHEDYYITHEYLEINNDPCYVKDFLEKLKVFDLSFLTEADVHLTIAENFGAETGQLLRTLSDNNHDRMEQYIDFLTGRTFRQSILVRRERANDIQRNLKPDAIRDLHLSTKVSPDPHEVDGRFVFKDAAGKTLTTSSSSVRDAVQKLAQLWPLTASPSTLADGETPPGAGAEITNALFTMVLAGLADISTVPVVAGAEIADRPRAAELARFDARSGYSWTTNVRHETVHLNLVQRAVLPLLDGSHDRKAISVSLQKLVDSGDLQFSRAGEPLTEPTAITDAIDEHIDAALNVFRKTALLMSAEAA